MHWLENLLRKRNYLWFVVKNEEVKRFLEVWNNLSVVSVSVFACYLDGRGENTDIKLVCKTSYESLWDRFKLQNKLDKLEKWSVEKKIYI